MLYVCVQKLMWWRENKKNLEFRREENKAQGYLKVFWVVAASGGD
jgi:hypothetical protein